MTDILDMNIYVPSRSRFVRSMTLEALHGHWDNKRIFLVVPRAQAPQYQRLAKKHMVNLLACNADGIARTRWACGMHAKDKFIMFDDDLRFYRCTAKDYHLHMFGKYDMENMLTFVSRLLDTHKHVSIAARGGHNQLHPLGYPFVELKRPLRVLAYRKKQFLACEHGRVAIMEDFDITLQLIKQGYKNAVITEYAQDQIQTQMPGGCSDYRTHKVHELNVRKMAALHPGIVKLRDKENKTGGEFGSRLELTIFWQKCFEQTIKELL